MAEKVKKTSVMQKIKQIFIAGIFACLPLVVTIYLILFLYRLVTGDVLPIVAKIAAKYHYTLPSYVLQLSAFLVVITIIFFIGLITRAYIGGKIFKLIEKIVSTIPIARTIYYGTKQVIESFKTTTGTTFSKVVLVEFPRRDMWMVAFVVKNAQSFMAQPTVNTDDAYNVFVPTAPNPTSGFVSIVPKCDVRELNVTVEDAIKFVISVGLVNINPISAEKEIGEAADKDVH